MEFIHFIASFHFVGVLVYSEAHSMAKWPIRLRPPTNPVILTILGTVRAGNSFSVSVTYSVHHSHDPVSDLAERLAIGKLASMNFWSLEPYHVLMFVADALAPTMERVPPRCDSM